MAPAKRTILCVDDEENAVLLRKVVLERVGYEVESALSGADALRVMEQGSFDLVLADYIMPQMNGAELASHIKALYPQTLVVLISGINEIPPDAARADHFISKMEGPAALCQKIAALLDSRGPVETGD